MLCMATLALTLSSCVKMQIGECIRASTTVRVGVTQTSQADKRYYWIAGESCYEYVPEVTYRWNPKAIKLRTIKGLWPAEAAFDITPTGRTHLVEFSRGEPYRLKEALPPHAEMHMRPVVKLKDIQNALPDNQVSDWRYLGSFSVGSASRGSTGACVLAAPFDYCLDPLLSIAASPLYPVFLFCNFLTDDT